MGLFKLRIGMAIMLTALAGMAVTPGALPAPGRITILALAVLLASAAAGAFNQYAERDVDARMGRTRARPFVTGRYRPGPGWLGAIGALLAMAVVAAALATNVPASIYVFLGAFVYGVVYTVWLKRRTWFNIVIGGLSGSFAVLAGAAAVDPSLPAAALVFAAVLFLWTPPHFWSLAYLYRDEYRAAGVPMLPAVATDAVTGRVVFAHTAVLSALALAPAALGMGAVYLAGAAAGGAWFTCTSWAFARAPNRSTARANFFASLGQLTLLIAAALLDRAVQ
jgi:protoheme IX farnesyltransferase